ncbi:hypothetical protein ACQPU1_08070 [Clostridium paraputrificum]|uniref:hypothetical protein n=1 Tax=Clostridium TaxID=1485 RepID=UPI003D34F250
MVRYSPPYYGMRFLADKKNLIIHDLDNESTMCHINDIEEEDIIMMEVEDDVRTFCEEEGYNGCYWCNTQFNDETIIY